MGKALEKNLTSDVEISRSDMYIRAHTTKENEFQFPEVLVSAPLVPPDFFRMTYGI